MWTQKVWVQVCEAHPFVGQAEAKYVLRQCQTFPLQCNLPTSQSCLRPLSPLPPSDQISSLRGGMGGSRSMPHNTHHHHHNSSLASVDSGSLMLEGVGRVSTCLPGGGGGGGADGGTAGDGGSVPPQYHRAELSFSNAFSGLAAAGSELVKLQQVWGISARKFVI